MTTKKLFCVLIAVISLALPVGFAQVYLGAEFSQLLTRSTAELSNRDVGAQLGLNLSGLGLRASAQGDLSARSLDTGSVDALLNVPLFGSTFYLGAGGDVDLNQLVALSTQQTGLDNALQAGVFSAHAVAGAEARLGPFGVFGEVQPVYRLGQGLTVQDTYYLRTRAGFNLHF